MLKIKYFKLFFFVVVLALLTSSGVLAYEIQYPDFGFGGGQGFTFDLPLYINYIFQFLIMTVGTIGIILIAVSGFKVLLSFGSPEKLGQAWGNIRSIILGILLLMTSFIILKTINYELVNPTITVLPPNTGIYLRNQGPNGYKYRPAPKTIRNINNAGLPLPIELYYYCANQNTKNLLVWAFKAFNNTVTPGPPDIQNQTTFILECNNPLGLDGYNSYSIATEVPGVYFYATNNCSGFSSVAYLANKEIGYAYKGSGIKSMRIVNGINLDERYGVILNNAPSGDGECSEPIVRAPSGPGCFTTAEFPAFSPSTSAKELNPRYVYVMNYDVNAVPPLLPLPSPIIDQNGVDFQSDNLFARFWQSGSPVTGYDIGPMMLYKKNNPAGYHEIGNIDKLIRDSYIGGINKGITSTGSLPRYGECCTADSDPADEGCCLNAISNPNNPNSPPQCLEKIIDPDNVCFNSLEINGSYYVAIYAQNQNTGRKTCKIFTARENSMSSLLGPGRTFYKAAIIPRYGN